MKFSNRIHSVQESPIRKLVPIADKAEQDGKKIYYLNIGQPDIETPQEFLNAISSYNDKILAYTSSQGIPELLNSFSQYYKRFNIHFDPDEIIITNGGSEAILFTLMVLCDHGDEIIIPEPFYANYRSITHSLGVNIKPITTTAESGFHLPSREEIESLFSDKTKAIMLSNPSNPTGTVYTKEEVHMLATIAKEKDVFIISDEVYREFIYSDEDYVSFATIKSIEQNMVLIDSISKRYSSCGARIGCVASKNKDFLFEFLKLCQSRLCVSILNQIGAAALNDVPDNYIQGSKNKYKKRRDLLLKELSEIEGVLCKKPDGAFYVIVRLPVDNAEDFSIWLLEHFDVNGETLFLSPAEDFYETKGLGENEVRMAYVLNTESLKKSMNILKLGLEAYNSL